MFYNQEYFQRRKGGLGIYWLAATLGPSSAAIKKLSKKEILDCNIPKAVDKLIHPEEPLALRLSSNLMFGVTRIYSYQCNYLHQNATTTSSSLKHAIIKLDFPKGHAQSGKDGTNKHGGILLITQEANGNGKDGIDKIVNNLKLSTAREDMAEFMNGEFEAFFGGADDFAWQALRDEVNDKGTPRSKKRKAVGGLTDSPGLASNEWDEEELARQMEEQDGDYIERGSKKKARTAKGKGKEGPEGNATATSRRNTTVARPEDINLPAHLMDNQLDFGHELEFEPIYDLDPDFDLGLQDLPGEVTDLAEHRNHRPRGSSVTVAGELLPFGASGGPDTSGTGAGGGFDFDFGDAINGPGNDNGMVDNVFGDDGFELGLDDLNGNQEDDFYAAARDGEGDNRPRQVSEVVEEARKNSPEGEAAVVGPPTPPPSGGEDLDGPGQDQGEAGNEAGRDKAASKTVKKPASKKKPSVPVRDKFTTLHSDDLAKNREKYTDEMKKANRARDLDRFEKIQKEKVGILIAGPPVGIAAPALIAFFNRAIQLDDFTRALNKGKKSKTPASTRKAHSVAPSLPSEDLSATTDRRNVREGTAFSSQIGRGYRQDQQEAFQFDDGFGQGVEDGASGGPAGEQFDFGAFQGDAADGNDRQASVARSFSVELRKQRGSSIFAEEANVGRDRASSVSYGQMSQMPWNTSYSSAAGFGNVPSSAARYSVGKAPSVIPGTPNFAGRSRSASIGFGGHSSLMRGGPGVPRADSPFVGADGTTFERGGTPMYQDEPEPGRESPAPSIESSRKGRESSVVAGGSETQSIMVLETDSQMEVRLESESRNFYLYAQRHAQGPSNEVTLSNIIPVERTAPIVAAQAFYHTLMLASKGLFKIHPQAEAYGEIRLSVIKAHQSQSQSRSSLVAV